MGNWHIAIDGVGCHHNGKKEIDADAAFVEFVDRLKADGHSVMHASFTYGGAADRDGAQQHHESLAEKAKG